MKKFVQILVLTLYLIPLVAVAKGNASEFSREQKKEYFSLGQKMAECGAFFRFLAELPTVKDKPNTVELAASKARGWEGAALIFLLSGSSEDAQFRIRETLNAIVHTKKIENLSRFETMGEQAITDIQKDFDTVCMPLVPVQMRAVESMRSGN